MAEYIDRDALLRRKHGCDRKDCSNCDFFTDGDSWCQGEIFVVDVLNVPAADVVKVTRCKDCEYWKHWCGTPSCEISENVVTNPNHYCANGRKKDG